MNSRQFGETVLNYRSTFSMTLVSVFGYCLWTVDTQYAPMSIYYLFSAKWLSSMCNGRAVHDALSLSLISPMCWYYWLCLPSAAHQFRVNTENAITGCGKNEANELVEKWCAECVLHEHLTVAFHEFPCRSLEFSWISLEFRSFIQFDADWGQKQSAGSIGFSSIYR